MKKFEVIMSTSYGHKLVIEAEDEDQAKKKANELSNGDVEQQADSFWDVDGSPMICDWEEIKE